MKIAHIGIAVADIDEATRKYTKLLGSENIHRELVPSQGVEIVSFKLGDARVELTASTRADSAIAKFIAKRGEGIHHIAFEVLDVAAELSRLASEDVRLVNQSPVPGGHNMQIAFLHPESFNSVLIELCQQ